VLVCSLGSEAVHVQIRSAVQIMNQSSLIKLMSDIFIRPLHMISENLVEQPCLECTFAVTLLRSVTSRGQSHSEFFLLGSIHANPEYGLQSVDPPGDPFLFGLDYRIFFSEDAVQCLSGQICKSL